MSVQRFTRKEMQKIISEIMDRDVQVLPIGNHELRRHLVYRVIADDDEYVFKYYYQKNYGNREIASLKSLNESRIHVPKLVSYGMFGDSREWLLMNYMKGMPMVKVMHHVPRERQLELFEEMGQELGAIHEYKKFDFFGEWDENGQPIHEHDTFLDAFMLGTERTFDIIKNRPLPNEDLLQTGLKLFHHHKDLLLSVTEPHHAHLDYDARNIHIRKKEGQWHLSAIFDFEQSKPWDKDADFVHLYLKHFYNDPDLEDHFFKGYVQKSSLGPTFKDKFDLYMLYQCLSICTWAFQPAPDYYEQALEVLKDLIKKM